MFHMVGLGDGVLLAESKLGKGLGKTRHYFHEPVDVFLLFCHLQYHSSLSGGDGAFVLDHGLQGIRYFLNLVRVDFLLFLYLGNAVCLGLWPFPFPFSLGVFRLGVSTVMCGSFVDLPGATTLCHP